MAFKQGQFSLCGSALASTNSVDSENQYRAKLKSWNIGKHATPNAWVFVNNRIEKRSRAGKKTDVLLYGELQPPRKVAKEIARNVTLVDTLHDLSDVPTPDGIEILTPCAASPLPVDVARTKAMSYLEFVGLMRPWIGTNATSLSVTRCTDTFSGSSGFPYTFQFARSTKSVVRGVLLV